MKYFFRSLQYLKPYRNRLAISIVCVLFIAVLWGGGLGMMLPGMKILTSDEGLHGWAQNTMISDRLDGRVVREIIPAGTDIDGQNISLVLRVVAVDRTGRAQAGGLIVGDWLLGLVDPTDGKREYLRGDELSKQLARWDYETRRVKLIVYNPASQASGQSRLVPIKLHRLKRKARLLGRLTSYIPSPQDGSGRVPMLWWLIGLVCAMTLLRNGLRFIQEYLVQTAVLRGMWDLREHCYNSALRQPITFFAEHGTTDTMSRFVQDSSELGRAQMTLFGKTLVEPAKAVASLVGAFVISWQMTLIALVAGPFAAILIRAFGKIIRRSTKRALENWADMLAVLEETLTGIRIVKAYTMEAAERKRFHRVNRQLYKQQRRMARTDAATSPSIEALGLTVGLLAAGGAGYLVLNHKIDMDIEDLITWMVMLAAIFDPVRKLSKVATRFQRGDAAAERIFEIRDRQKEKRTPGAPMLPRLSGSIELAGVEYTYPNANSPALCGIDLTIQAGQTVAIVGPNGCGKTTLVSLLPRLLEPSGGKILFDGRDVATHSLRSLRRQIALVSQDTVIFNATIGENISYGLRRPKPQQILDAAKKAYVDEFVRELPDGYDTMVGQRGATLSGGQRQRIAIARAILRDPAVLIFDEALSQIDPDSEQRISQAMGEFITGRTAVMIAHRFQTILAADAIVVMNEGQIVALGPHKQLLETCELYTQLYNTQFGNAK